MQNEKEEIWNYAARFSSRLNADAAQLSPNISLSARVSWKLHETLNADPNLMRTSGIALKHRLAGEGAVIKSSNV